MSAKMKISPTGAWQNPTNVGHCFDKSLAEAIAKFCERHELATVFDIGCGDGSYVNYLNKTAVLAIGVDGNPHTPEISKDEDGCNFCGVFDLTESLVHRMKRFGLILSLEVGEHIPVEHEGMFLRNVVKYANDWIILSWAIPGQNGDGHVNCRSNQYIIEQMLELKYAFVPQETAILREAAELPWFKDTLMVFTPLIS